MRLLLLLVALVMSGTAATAVAGPFEDAMAAYDKGDYPTALRLLLPLAEQGDRTAQYNVGIMYDNGRGTPRDSTVAVTWYRRAAEQGMADAQYNLGIAYGNGEGAPQNLVQAFMWFDLAAARYDASERMGRARALQNLDRLSDKMMPAQVAEARKLAREWKPKPER
jgi:TPR repeat protein